MPELKRRAPGQSQLRGIDNAFYAWRPAHHVQGRTVRSHGGDVLVQQVRSAIGHPDDVAQALATVGLGGIDRACFVAVSDSNLFGCVQAAVGLVSVEKLSTWVPPGNYDTWVFQDGVVMFRENYGAQQSPAELVVIGDGEYMQAESANDHVAVLWSSSEGVVEALTSARQVLGSLDAADSAFVQLSTTLADGESGAGSLDDVLEYLGSEQPEVEFVRVSMQRGEIVWTTPRVRIKHSKQEFAEIAVRVANAANSDLIDDLVARTASPELRAHRRDVESKIMQLSIT